MTERARAGQEDRRKWYRFENASSEENSIGFNPTASTSNASRQVRFTPSAVFGTAGGSTPKRSASRNGPNGIVISAPMQLRGGAGSGGPHGEGVTDVYGEMEEVRNGASSRASSRGGNGLSVPPPVYSGGH